MTCLYSSRVIIVVLLLHLTFTRTSSSSLSIREKLSSKYRQRFSSHVEQPINATDQDTAEEEEEQTSVIVLTSLSGIYIWWPVLFGGDDSFYLLLNQEDVPRFHDVTGDNRGNIYLTAPHERTVYRLNYDDGWWIASFSNHSVMNSIRSEMPLFVTVHYISSVLYVYGHSDIQLIDLLERPHARGSAPFMKRLRELSPNLRISDMIIDQSTSEGYIIGDSYGWCTIIRCSLTVNQCAFLFKIPSSYDNRPYPCTATIDFTTKIIYLSLEEKILAVHLNEQTNFDRRFIVAEKRGIRSTLGYDDIVVDHNVLFYTDVLRPLLHICPTTDLNPCRNISLVFPSPQRSILPLRLSVVRVTNFRPPDDDEPTEINPNTTIAVPLSLIGSNRTTTLTSKTVAKEENLTFNSVAIFLLGLAMGLLLAGLSFMIYYVICHKNRPKIKQNLPSPNVLEPLIDESPIYSNDSSTENASDITQTTTSSSSYHPEIVL